jgi:hypothetical protein
MDMYLQIKNFERIKEYIYYEKCEETDDDYILELIRPNGKTLDISIQRISVERDNRPIFLIKLKDRNKLVLDHITLEDMETFGRTDNKILEIARKHGML